MTTGSSARGLRMLTADEDTNELRTTARRLEQLGHEVTACVATVPDACEMIAREDPDASVVVVHRDTEHALDLIEELTESSSGPVIALVQDTDPDFIRAAAERGIAAVASAATADDLQSALEIAVHRHAETRRLQVQVGQLEHALDRRAIIERAKGILMERHSITDREAFERLRAEARRTNRQVVEVSRAVADDTLADT